MTTLIIIIAALIVLLIFAIKHKDNIQEIDNSPIMKAYLKKKLDKLKSI